MSHLAPGSSIQFAKKVKVGQDTLSHESQWQSPHSVSIHILDNHSLLNIFYVYRPFVLGEDEDDEYRLSGGSSRWDLEHWWFKLTHVCQRWRGLILGSPTYLGLCLICTHGTPVMGMLAHSPPLPLAIDYLDDITTDEEEGIIFALEQRDREYPILEYLIMRPSIEDNSSVLRIPESLQAPHLRHLSLTNFTLPLGSRLLTTATELVTLNLRIIHPSTYFQPNALLQWLSFMPQLETLVIILIPVRNLDVERQTTRMPVTHLTLPNLRRFEFRGISAYVEAVVHRITTPRLEKLQISFFNQLTFSVPHLRQFMSRTENFRFASARFKFSSGEVSAEVYPGEETEKYALQIRAFCGHLDWQLSSVAQIFNSLSQMFSEVEGLSLDHDKHSRSTEEHNEVDRSEWRKLLMSFSSVKTLYVNHGLFEELSHCLPIESGKSPLQLLPLLPKISSQRILEQIFAHPSLFRRPKHHFEDSPSETNLDNEQLIILGNQIYGLVVTDLIRDAFPSLRIGPSSGVRERLKYRDKLAKIAVQYGLHERLRVQAARADEVKGSVLARAGVFKAYVGGLYSEQGLDVVGKWLRLLLLLDINEAYAIVRSEHLLPPFSPI